MPRFAFDKLAKDYKDWNVIKARVVRSPLNAAYQTLGNLVGNKDYIHDKFYHLYTELALQDPSTGRKQVVRIEKHANVGGVDGRKGGVDDGHEARNVEVPDNTATSSRITFGDFVKGGKRQHITEKRAFYSYNIRDNNCQDWTATNLRGSGLYNDDLDKFVNQHSQDIISPAIGTLATIGTGAIGLKNDIMDAFQYGSTQGLKETISGWFGYKPLSETPISRYIETGITRAHYSRPDAVVGEPA